MNQSLVEVEEDGLEVVVSAGQFELTLWCWHFYALAHSQHLDALVIMLAVEIHEIGGLMPTQASMQVGDIVWFTSLKSGLASFQSTGILRIVLELDTGQLNKLLFPIRDEATLGDFQGTCAHLIQREGRIRLDGLSGHKVIISIVLSHPALFRHIVLLFLPLVAALPALFIDKRGIKLLFIHYYHSIIQVELSGQGSIATGIWLLLGGRCSSLGFFAATARGIAAATGVAWSVMNVDSIFWLVFFAELWRWRGGRARAGRRRRKGKRHLLLAIFVAHGVAVFLIKLHCSLVKLSTLDNHSTTFSCRQLRKDSANFLLSLRVVLHTLSKQYLVMTFCVTAIVSSKLITACHKPPGTNTVSPGYWMNSIICNVEAEYFSLILGRISKK